MIQGLTENSSGFPQSLRSERMTPAEGAHPSTTLPEPLAEAPGFPGRISGGPRQAHPDPGSAPRLPRTREDADAEGAPAVAVAASPGRLVGDPDICSASSLETMQARGCRPCQARFQLPGRVGPVRHSVLEARLPLLGRRALTSWPDHPPTHKPRPGLAPELGRAVTSTWRRAPKPAADPEASLQGPRRPRSSPGGACGPERLRRGAARQRSRVPTRAGARPVGRRTRRTASPDWPVGLRVARRAAASARGADLGLCPGLGSGRRCGHPIWLTTIGQ